MGFKNKILNANECEGEEFFLSLLESNGYKIFDKAFDKTYDEYGFNDEELYKAYDFYTLGIMALKEKIKQKEDREKDLMELNLNLQISNQNLHKTLDSLEGDVVELRSKYESDGDMVIVPKKPTQEMVDSVVENLALSGGIDIVRDIYIEMVNYNGK